MKYLNDLKNEGYQQVHEFKESEHDWAETFVKNKQALKSMNAVLGAGFKAVYIRKRTPNGGMNVNYAFKDGEFNMDGENIYVWTSKDKIVRFTNSEWGSAEII